MKTVATIAIVVILLILLLMSLRTENFIPDEEESLMITNLNTAIFQICPELKFSLFKGEKSFTIDKKEIFICLRNKKTKQIYDFDILLYVTLHEIAHVISKTWSNKNHNEEFHNNFKRLLKIARDKKILSENVHVPSDYCS